MGYNTWNAFKFGINETLIRQTADKMVSLGLRQAGYTYLSLDDGWSLGQRNGSQAIDSDPTLFPSGMKALAGYVHASGLRFGVYSDAGTATCGLHTGSLGYEKADAAQFAAWGVDLLKYDNCLSPPADVMSTSQRYEAMRDALNATGRPIAFCMCDWGSSSAWIYGSKVGNSWRTTQDIALGWDSVMANLDGTIGLSRYAGPGAWNDADMLEIGPQGKLSGAEASAHMALWAILKSPLIIGADLSALDNDTLAILKASEVIAVNQDGLGVAGDLVWKQGPAEVYAAPLSGGARAVVLLNRHFMSDNRAGTHNMTAFWKAIGIPPAEMTQATGHAAAVISWTGCVAALDLRP
ncbi:hypothetical protein WJX81_002251 [Elliptochloris bilobata]|uniref:Alpha-galactosidase n=1 Tax=Elliptochloris bilobata TaxID=381761 RepID=A0AAW1RMA6_9CHLO